MNFSWVVVIHEFSFVNGNANFVNLFWLSQKTPTLVFYKNILIMNPFTFFFFQKFFRTEKFARSQPAADSFRVERHFETPFEQVNNFQRDSFVCFG